MKQYTNKANCTRFRKLIFSRVCGRVVALAIVFWASSLAHVSIGQSDPLSEELEKIMQYEFGLDFSIVPGVVIGIWDQDQQYIRTFGDISDDKGYFELGSLTKPVVAWLAEAIMTRSHLEPNSSICEVLPDSVCHAAWAAITIQEILDHRSGIPRWPPDIGRVEADVRDPYALYAFPLLYSDVQSITPVKNQFQYSHVGYAMLMSLFGSAYHAESFLADQLKKHDLSGISFTVPDNEIIQGHGLDGRPQPVWHTNALLTSLGMKANATGFLNWMQKIAPELNAQLAAPTFPDAKTFRMIQKKDEFVVLDGWFCVMIGKDIYVYHNGRTGGHAVSAAMIPALQKGVVVFSTGAQGPPEMGMRILEMVSQSH